MNEEPAIATQGREESELIPLTVIRTETVLSKLPIHNLAKKGSIDISIIRKNSRGDLKLKWEVTYANRYGRPGQLAYKLDTLVINRRIDATGRPLPTYVPLGSLRDIARELGLGGDTQKVKKALRQNAGAFITAKLTYKTVDGAEKVLEADFNRYGVIFKGEKLPDGRRADEVYVTFNEPYREVLNNAPVRPLDYDYLKRLPPSPQRFYEIVSYRIFAAIKFRHSAAKLPYSEYCTFSAQQRYFEYEPFRKQMYKIHRPHLAAGYLANIRYEETRDDEGHKDWLMYYEPGPKARAEYRSFTGDRQRVVESAPTFAAPRENTNEMPIRRSPPRQRRLTLKPEQPTVDPELLAELTKRGVSSSRAVKLLSTIPKEQNILGQLEWGDQQIRQAARGEIRNPAGFYIHLVEENVPPPHGFEMSRARREREEAQHTQNRKREEEERQRSIYHDYREQETARYVTENLADEERGLIVREEEVKARRQYPNLPARTIREIAERSLFTRVAERITFLSFEAFWERERQQPQPGSTATAV